MPTLPDPHEEVVLLRDTRRFLRARIRELTAMLGPSRALRARLAASGAFRRVDGSDSAQDDPVWDTAGTLEICFERAVEELIASLRNGVASARPRRRRGRTAGEHFT